MRQFFLLLCLLGVSLHAGYEFQIQPRTYLLSTHYDVYSEDRYISTVEQEHLRLNTVYSVCDRGGEYARGIAKLFSLGSIFQSLREIDFYDERGNSAGSIEGHLLTTASGKFTFYDPHKRPFATAYIDRSGASVTIVNSTNEREPYALFRRSYIPGGGDYFWEVKVLDESALEPSILYIFAAFVTDSCWPSGPKREESTPSWETLLLLDIITEIIQDD